ncbi:unnamed protein product [Polarella glacialis]|uniref:Uncharacterized protein n=1 Tax=Polarella glacialis TaxID=89957 RepID=A0A813EWH4_POLGL|nr:unnamed protein product [Polarella glacialis]
MIEKQYAIELTWSESALDRINSQVEAMLSGDSSHWGALKAHSPALLSFLENDCDFNCEHADGSFLDHLQFCYEYCHIHFPAASPVVLFLHSIMGVGTNLFPMKLEQRPQLANLVTAEELAHIEAFPTVLRLLQTGLLEELNKMPKEQLLGIEGIECYRLLGPEIDTMKKSDNHPLHLTGEQFWVHLNYHLIHFLDFLPASQWEVKMGIEGLACIFPLVHRVLTRAGKLMANIQFDSEKWAAVPETPESKQGKAEVLIMAANFSGGLGHSLDYKLKR